MIDVGTAFLLFSLIIFVGYFSSKLFEKIKIPDAIILMLLGLLMGPIFNIFGDTATAAFRAVIPYFAAVALILILFETGLHLNFFKVLKTLSTATIFTAAVSGLTIILITGAAFFIFGWPILPALLFGIIIAGTDSAVVVYLMQKTSASDDTKTLVDLETTMNDMQIILAFAVIAVMNAQQVTFSIIGERILASFSISAIAGFVAALLWLKLHRKSSHFKYEYLLTLAVLFMLYSFVEYFQANGAVAAFVFGMVLGNSREITSMLRMEQKAMDGEVEVFQEEISFFVRTFFFVYLGVIFEPAALNIWTGAAAMLLMGIIVISRYAAAKFILSNNGNFKKDLPLISSAMARGISAAVLASIPLSMGLGEVGKNIFNLTFMVILFSNIFTAAGIFLAEAKRAKGKSKDDLKDDGIEEIRLVTESKAKEKK